MEDRFKLNQEVGTPFGFNLNTVQRFLKFKLHMPCLVDGKSGDAAEEESKFLSRLTHQFNTNNFIFHPALKAISASFASIRHVQIALDACTTTTLLKMLSMLEYIKQRLHVLAHFLAQPNDLFPPHSLYIQLASVYFEEINLIYLHDMWCAACVLHSWFNVILIHISRNITRTKAAQQVPR